MARSAERIVGCLLISALAACGGGAGSDAGADASMNDTGLDVDLADLGRADAGCTSDSDGDGHRSIECGGDDCDDTDPMRYPGHVEICDAAGHDDDCNLATLGPDRDGDGFPATTCCNTQMDGTRLCGADCNDSSMDISPTAPESCNGIDDNCDGIIDNGLSTASYTPDCDGDGFGDASATPMVLCTIPGTAPSCSTGAWVTRAGDCDDGNSSRHPGAPEACTGIDANCDGTADPGADADGDGHRSLACGGDDCDDTDMTRYPGNHEICDAAGHDEDCDPTTMGPDVDGDGFPSVACCNLQPSGAVLCGRDCDDSNASVFPGALEVCNGIDDDCNGVIDDLTTTLMQLGSVIMATSNPGLPPTLTGGSLLDGTYVLTAVVDYSTSTPGTLTHQETWQVTGTIVERIVSDGGGPNQDTSSIMSTSGTMMTLDERCPTAGGTVVAHYTATPAFFQLSIGDPNEIRTYTKL